MFCGNCGASVNDGMQTCPNCGAGIANNGYSQPVNNMNYYDQNTGYQATENKPEVKTTGLLVWSIIELCCVNTITGIIGLVFYFTQLKPAIERGDMAEVARAKRNIKITLWIGLGLFLVVLALMIIPLIVAVVLPMANNTRDLIDSSTTNLYDLQSSLNDIQGSSSYDYSDYDFDYDFDYDY